MTRGTGFDSLNLLGILIVVAVTGALLAVVMYLVGARHAGPSPEPTFTPTQLVTQ